MNTKLLLFLVLLCIPTQPFHTASGLSISGFGRVLGRLEKIISRRETICQFIDFISGGKYNCSSLLPGSTVSYAANTDQTTPDVSVDGFTITLSVGGGTTQNVSLILDTTIDYTFMMCTPCRDSCSTNLTVYDPSLSNTLSNYTCGTSKCPSLKDNISCSGGYCMYNYNESVSSEGPLVNDTLNLDTSPFPFVFGCGDVNTGNYEFSIGYLGLGYGGLSLLSQLTEFGKFSYCFGSSGSAAFLLGSNDTQLNTSSGSSTGLLQNLLVPVFHYVNFTGASLGGEHVNIPSSNYLPQLDGTGGMILTSTYAYTYLESSAYDALKDAFVNKMSSFSLVNGSEYGLDLCFDTSGQQVTVPQLTLHFDSGAVMNPNNSSYFATNSDGTVGCLLLLPIQGVSVLGYYMQYDTQMIYDVSKGVLQFEQIDCSTL